MSVRHGRGVMLSVIAYGAAMLLLGVVLLLVSRGGAPGWGTAACLVPVLMFAGVAGVGRAFPQLWRSRREVAA